MGFVALYPSYLLGRHAALLVERFDVQSAHGRLHRLSVQTLLGVEGWYQLGYSDVADLVRRVSARPELDLPALYRQAVFNAVLGNTDDHLKNCSMLHRREGWRLAPAYDLTPDESARGEHVLHFGTAEHRPDTAALERLALAFGLSASKGARIRREVAEALSGWRAMFRDYAISAADYARLATDTERRRLPWSAGVFRGAPASSVERRRLAGNWASRRLAGWVGRAKATGQGR